MASTTLSLAYARLQPKVVKTVAVAVQAECDLIKFQQRLAWYCVLAYPL